MTNSIYQQSSFLDDLIQAKKPVAIYLKNSICLKGIVIKHTDEEVHLKDPMKIQVILKRNVSTVEARENLVTG